MAFKWIQLFIRHENDNWAACAVVGGRKGPRMLLCLTYTFLWCQDRSINWICFAGQCCITVSVFPSLLLNLKGRFFRFFCPIYQSANCFSINWYLLSCWSTLIPPYILMSNVFCVTKPTWRTLSFLHMINKIYFAYSMEQSRVGYVQASGQNHTLEYIFYLQLTSKFTSNCKL